MGFTSFNPSYGLYGLEEIQVRMGAQVRAILEDGRSGIAIGIGDRVVHYASRFLGMFLENLAAPLGRAQSPAVKIGEHFLGRGAESYTFDRADLGETDQAQRQGLRLGGLLRFGPFLGLGGFLHGLWHRLTLSDSAKKFERACNCSRHRMADYAALIRPTTRVPNKETPLLTSVPITVT